MSEEPGRPGRQVQGRRGTPPTSSCSVAIMSCPRHARRYGAIASQLRALPSHDAGTGTGTGTAVQAQTSSCRGAPLLTIAQRSVRLGDPHDCTDAADTLAMSASLFDALVRWGAGGEFEAGLACSWALSEDCRSWTFTMVPGVLFHNGEKCDAEAAAYSLRRMARPDIGATLGAPAVWAQYLENSVVTVLGPLTVRITTAMPVADLLDVIAAGPVLPPRALEAPGVSCHTYCTLCEHSLYIVSEQSRTLLIAGR